MTFDVTRALRCGRGLLLWPALVAGCVTPAGAGAPPVGASRSQDDLTINHPRQPSFAASTTTRATRCPLPARVTRGYDLSQLSVFLKTLFFVRENSPVDVGPRARELVVGALREVASQEKDIVVESDSASPPRWVTVIVGEQRCTLNLDRVDAPWSLRSTVGDALRFVQGNLGPAAPGVEPAERLPRIEVAATNGMLWALDGRSALLDAETYQKLRARVADGDPSARADGDVVDSQEFMKAGADSSNSSAMVSQRVSAGAIVAYARLGGFAPGASADVERWLATSAGERVKGRVLDLRDNAGGLLGEAVKVADAFIKEGALGAAVNGAPGRQHRTELVARDDGREPGGALVVLVNRRTAAASELVAAAIKNLGRGVVIGEPTAGVASIRTLFDVSKGLRPPTPSLHTAADRDFIQDVIDGKAPTPPPVVQPYRDPEPLGLVLVTGRLLASGGAEIERVGAVPDLKPSCPAGERVRPDEDCLMTFAQEVIARSKDAQRSTLLSVAKALVSPSPGGGRRAE